MSFHAPCSNLFEYRAFRGGKRLLARVKIGVARVDIVSMRSQCLRKRGLSRFEVLHLGIDGGALLSLLFAEPVHRRGIARGLGLRCGSRCSRSLRIGRSLQRGVFLCDQFIKPLLGGSRISEQRQNGVSSERFGRWGTGHQVAGVAGVSVDLSLIKMPEDASMFPNQPAPGEPFSLTAPRNPRNTTKEIIRRFAKLGFPQLRLHDLRGTHETLMLDAGVPVHLVAARGRRDPAVLLRNYAKRTKKADVSAAAVIGSLSKGLPGGVK